MSFFGFDPSIPPHKRNEASEAYDFENTYDGLGEQLNEADDALNDETFGGSGAIGKDFNFGTNQPGNGVGQPQSAQPAQPVQPAQPAQPAQPVSLGISYAQAVSNPTNDDDFMKDLWGTNAPSTGQQPPQQPPQSSVPPQSAQGPEKKILSLEEIEAQLTSIDHQQQRHQLPQQSFGMPGMMPPNNFMPPPGFMPPPVYGGQFPQQNVPPPMMPGVMQQMPNQVQMPPQMGNPHVPPQSVAPPPAHHPTQPPNSSQGPVQPPVAGVPPGPNPPATAGETMSHALQGGVPNEGQQKVVNDSSLRAGSGGNRVNYSQFPVLGSKGNKDFTMRPYSKQDTMTMPPVEFQEPQELTPEQQAKLARRQDKVSRIMRYSGIMNPKDKDFVTRFQLSQIVNEDPYSEDFYAQVYKVIHPKFNDPSQQQQAQQNNSIAQAYLDQSGHRLGGRNKRADIALQRMQQQVQRAVTVAKERPKLTQYAREGALGKISFGNGKKPRQQLEIFSKAVQKEIEKEAVDGKDDELDVKKISSVMKKQRPATTVSSDQLKKYSKKEIMGILENIITNLMAVESESRLSSNVDTTNLWESLKLLEQSSSKVNDPAEINPFIQCLNHEKALKILSRLFKFLSREQILTIATLIMSNLENLLVIKNGSYTKYDNKRLPSKVSKLVEAYSLTFNKVLMNAVQDFKFNEIIGLLVILIEHNNVSYVSTTKIGLSILTTLLSRAELIRGEGTISATDLSEWSSCYDELFTSLETHINAIFPPHDNEIETANESYVWQFLATLSLGGKLSHQRIIVDEVRDEIFSVMNKAKAIDNSDINNFYKKQSLLNNLNMFLVVMGLVADENEIKELQA